jgi:Uma2 family endonuclease
MIRYARTAIDEIGPEDAGTRFTAAEFERLPGREGHRYELIEGVLHVSPAANPIHAELQRIICKLLEGYRDASGASVFVRALTTARLIVESDPAATTNPEPDVAGYQKFPSPPPASYEGIEPAIVVEVVSPGSHDKDYGRNPELYERVASIMEYWIIDPTRGRERPAMTVFRRPGPGGEFERIEVPQGGVYESTLWPGLRIDLGRLWS